MVGVKLISADKKGRRMAYLFTTFEYSVSHYSYISMSVSSSDCSYCYI